MTGALPATRRCGVAGSTWPIASSLALPRTGCQGDRVIGASAPSPTYVTYVGDRVVDSASSARPGMLRSLARLSPVAVGAGVLTLIGLLVIQAWGSYEQPLWVAIPIQLVGLPFVLGGTALWVQRPGNYLGPFCVFLGGAWYLGDLQAFDEEFLFVIGFSLYHLNLAVFAHLALMVPNGRLVGRLDHLVVIALYITIPVTQFLRYLEVRPYIDRTMFGDMTAYYSSWARVATYVGAPLAAAAAALVVSHSAGPSRPSGGRSVCSGSPQRRLAVLLSLRLDWSSGQASWRSRSLCWPTRSL